MCWWGRVICARRDLCGSEWLSGKGERDVMVDGSLCE